MNEHLPENFADIQALLPTFRFQDCDTLRSLQFVVADDGMDIQAALTIEVHAGSSAIGAELATREIGLVQITLVFDGVESIEINTLRMGRCLTRFGVTNIRDRGWENIDWEVTDDDEDEQSASFSFYARTAHVTRVNPIHAVLG